MGFSLNGIHNDAFEICIKTESLPGLASKRQKSISVQGRDGQHVVEDGYDNVTIRYKCSLHRDTIALRRKATRQIFDWLSNTGPLITDYEPDVIYHVVKVTSDINVKFRAWNVPIEDFEIVFTCKPYQSQSFYLDEITWEEAATMWDEADFPWDGFTRTFTVEDGDTISISNLGTYKALPIIKLSGVAATVTIGEFTYTNLSGDVYIDCDDQVVYTLSGDTKVTAISNFSGDFPSLAPGINEFAVSGTITNLIVEYDFKNTYL